MNIQGIRFNLTLTQQGSATRTPLIWSHGLMSNVNADVPHLHFDELSHVTPIVRYDARGHGGTASTLNPVDYTWPHLAEDMKAIADTLQFPSFVAGGDSMGAATAIYAALKFPQHVKGLLLVIPPTAWEGRRASKRAYLQLAQWVKTHGAAEYAKKLQQTPQHWGMETIAPQLVKSVTQMEALPTVLEGAASSDLPHAQVLGSIKIPTLIMSWENDPHHPVTTAETLHALIPSSRLTVAPNKEELKSWPHIAAQFLQQF